MKLATLIFAAGLLLVASVTDSTFAEVGGLAGVGNYTGPVSMTGNRADGSDQISEVSLNGALNPQTYGALAWPAAASLPTGTISAGALNTLVLSAPFTGQALGSKVAVIGAGANTPLATPAAPTDAGSGCASGCTTAYAVVQMDIDPLDGMTVPGPAFSYSDNATLSLSGGNFLKINPYVQTGTAQHAYYLSSNGGVTYTLWGCFPDATVPLFIAASTAPLAYGCPDFVSSTLPTAAVPQILISVVDAGPGTLTLTLHTPATNVVTSKRVYPLSGDAINAVSTALTTAYNSHGGVAIFPGGILYTAQQIVMGQDQHWQGASGASSGTLIKAVDQITAGPMFDMVRTVGGQFNRRLAYMTIDGNNIAGGLRNADNQMRMDQVAVQRSQIGPGLELKGTQNSTLADVTIKFSLNGLLESYNPSVNLCANFIKMVRGEIQSVAGYQAAIISPNNSSSTLCYYNNFDNSLIGDFVTPPHYTDLTTDAGASVPKAEVILVNAAFTSFTASTQVLGLTTVNDRTIDSVIAVGCTNCVSGGRDAGGQNWFTNMRINTALTGMDAADTPALINHDVSTYFFESALGGYASPNTLFVSDRQMNIFLPTSCYYSGAVNDTGTGIQRVTWLGNCGAGGGFEIPLNQLNLTQGGGALSITGSTSGNVLVRSPAVAGTNTNLTLPAASSVMLANAVGTPTYGTTVTPDLSTGRVQQVTITDGSAWTLAGALNATAGQYWNLDLINSSGGAGGAITLAGVYRGTITAPANNKVKECLFAGVVGGYRLVSCSADE